MRKFVTELAGPLDDHMKRTRPMDRRGQHPQRGGGEHAGLLLQRYLCEIATGVDGNPNEKQAILAAAINAAKHSDVQALYKTAFERWSRSLPQIPKPIDLTTQGRLIVGLGSENVLETGIRLHHTYGMPIIPGSALKGLAAHFCDQVWEATDGQFEKGHAFHQLLFGTTDDSGCVIFHDAWFVPSSDAEPLKLDVMTPHHTDYNRDPADAKFRAPTDFDSPIPVPFLSVAGAFRVAVSWRGPLGDQSENWTELAMSLLRDALFDWGVGGKTTSGYGRFNKAMWEADEVRRQEREVQQQKVLKEAAALAAMSPLERKIKEVLDNYPSKAEKRIWFRLYDELRKPDGRFQEQNERIEIAKMVKQGMQEAEAWKDKGKDGERKKLIEGILGHQS